MKKTKQILLLATLIFSFNLQAQTLKTPAPSPLQTIKQAFGLADVTIEYSRPSAKGRVIYGDLVPYGKMWRTGANSATKITFGDDVKLSGNALSAGTYALYTIPGKEEWQILVYKDLTLGGNVNDYKAENELFRFTAKPTRLVDKVESFTIGFSDVASSNLNIELLWENTRIAFPVSTDIDAKIMKNIETAMAPADKRPYYQAANYFFENGKDLKQALEWVNKAIEQDSKAYWVVLLKAKIQLKTNDAKGAIATAEKVIALAKEDKNDEYVSRAEKLMAEAKSAK